MSDVIDDLKVQIDASTQNADAKLDKFITKMMQLHSTISGLELSNVSNIASGINQISVSVQNFNDRTKTADFSRVARGLNKLSAINTQEILAASQAMSSFAVNMAGLRDVHFDADGISNIANAISKLGRTSVTGATKNLELLKTSMATFITGMNGAGNLSFNPEGLVALVNSISRLGSTNATQSVNNLPLISTALRRFITDMNTVGSVTFDFTGLNGLVSNIARLGGAKATQAATNLKPIKDQILRFVSGLNGIGTINFDITGLSNLVSSITRLGGKAATVAIPNIQALGTAITQLMSTLSRAPLVSGNLIQMTNALASLSGNGSRVSSAASAMNRGLNLYSTSAKKAAKSTRSLVSQIGMFYAKCFLLIRGVKALWKATKSAMDYVETLNYFDSAWRQVSENAVGDWKKAGYESAEAYAVSFGERAKALTGKMTGFQPDATGNLISTGMPSLGMDPEKLMNYQATFGQMASSMGVASETALKLSNALTMIGADLASVKNIDFDKVWQDMSSGMVGMSRTVDKYGVNIRNVNMQEKLAELGINAKVTALNQQDKVLLRTIILLQSTKYAWGDLARTIGQPANQLRLLQANFENLARTIGNLLIPIVSKVLPYINALVIALQRLFSWIGGLLGINVAEFSSSIGSAATDFGEMKDASDGIADSTGTAAKNTKKMADNLQTFDKLNVVNSSNDSGGGSGSGGAGAGGGLLDKAFEDAFDEYQKAWDKAFSNMQNSAQVMSDNIVGAFQRIWDTAEPTREALKRLWDDGLAHLGDFTWTALKDFWNEFLVPVGKWTLGTGLPMLIDNLNAFLMKIDFPAINEALKNFWKALEPFATKVGEGLINFFGDLLSVGADFINYVVPDGLNGIAQNLKKIDSNTAEKIGYALGIVALGLMGFKTLGSVVGILDKLAGSMKKWSNLKSTFKFLGAVKYIGIAAGIAGLVIALDKFGVIKVNWSSLASGFKKLASALGKFISGIGQGLIDFIEGMTPIVSPILGTIINGIAGAFDFFCGVLNKIPSSWISGLTTTFFNLFAAFKTYELVVKAGGLITAFANNIKLLAQCLPGIVNSGPILSNLALALGPAGLGAIAFTVIAAGIFAIAENITKINNATAKNSGIGQFTQALSDLNEEVSQKTEEINKSLNSTKDSIETAGTAETQKAKDLADKYEALASKVSLSTDEVKKLKKISSELVDTIPSLKEYFDEGTGMLDIQKDSLDAVIQGYENLAQKQAAQESLVQAYKDQYEAQMNTKHAQDAYNDAMDETLKKSGLTKKALDDIKNGTLSADKIISGMGAPTLNGKVLNLEDYGFKANQVGAFKKAVAGAEKTLGEYNSTLEEAQKTEKKADENLKFINDTIEENDDKLKKNSEILIENKKATDEYKQSLKNLNTDFANLNITLSDDFLQNLALDDDFDIKPIKNFFDSLTKGVQASSSDLQQAFKDLGLSLPVELTDAIAKLEPNTQAEVTKMLMKIKSGAKVQGPELKTLFGQLGFDLPDAIADSLASKGGTVQTATLELLANIKNGCGLTEGNLTKVFATLGIKITDEGIIKALSDAKPDVQEKAIELLAQIQVAGEGERGPLIEQYNKLGIGFIDEGLIASLKLKEKDTKDAGANVIKQAAAGAVSESKLTGVGSFVEAAQNGIDGFLGKLTSMDAAKRLIKAGSDMAHSVLEGIKKGQDSHSPSKETAKLGGDAVDGYEGKITSRKSMDGLFDAGLQMAQKMLGGLHKGHTFGEVQNSMAELAGNSIKNFNQGLSDEMANSVPLVEKWLDSIKSVFSGYNIAFPGSDFTYRLGNDWLNQYAEAPKLSLPNFNSGSVSMDYKADLSTSLAGIIDYDRLGEAVYRAQSRAMQENPTVIGDSDIYDATRRGVSKHFAQTGKTGFKGID